MLANQPTAWPAPPHTHTTYQVAALATALCWLTNLLVALTFVPLAHSPQGMVGAYILYASVNVLALCFMYTLMVGAGGGGGSGWGGEDCHPLMLHMWVAGYGRRRPARLSPVRWQLHWRCGPHGCAHTCPLWSQAAAATAPRLSSAPVHLVTQQHPAF